MTQEEAIKVLRTESVEIGGNAVSVTRWLMALDAVVKALEDVTDKDVGKMTNADRIRATTDEELAEFLSSIAYGRETPWSEPFDEKFCKSCPTTTCTVEGYHHPMDLHECDFTDGKCPHGSDIVWWLQQPALEDDHDERKENENVRR